MSKHEGCGNISLAPPNVIFTSTEFMGFKDSDTGFAQVEHAYPNRKLFELVGSDNNNKLRLSITEDGSLVSITILDATRHTFVEISLSGKQLAFLKKVLFLNDLQGKGDLNGKV